jgi:hypothetical protein
MKINTTVILERTEILEIRAIKNNQGPTWERTKKQRREPNGKAHLVLSQK